MTLTTTIVRRSRCECDFPGCTTPPVETPVEAGFAELMKGRGWWIGDGDPRVCYCPEHAIAERAAGRI